MDRLAELKLTIPAGKAGVAAKVMLKHILTNDAVDLAGHEDVRSVIQREDQVIRAGEDIFGAKMTTQLQSLAEEILNARGAVILYDGMATLEAGSEDLAADLQALAVLTKQIDRPGAGVGPLFEDANSLGARDMGLLPDALPGYQVIDEPGLAYNEILTSPQIKALLVMGANPVRHLPGLQLSSELEFVIVQDLLLTETAQQADVVLPAVSFAEKEGSMTNVDHHVQAIRRALRPLPGAKADWEILTAMANYLGETWTYNSPRDILLEIADQKSLLRGPHLGGFRYAGCTFRGGTGGGSCLVS